MFRAKHYTNIKIADERRKKEIRRFIVKRQPKLTGALRRIKRAKS